MLKPNSCLWMTRGIARAVASCQSICGCEPPCPAGTELDPQAQLNREKSSFNIRVEAAVLEFNRDKPFLTTHPTNGDESLFQKLTSGFQNRFIASYTKGLPLNPDPALANLGEVDPEAYCALLRALESGDCEQFEAVPLGSKDPVCPNGSGPRNLEDPQGGSAFDLQGADSHVIFVRKTPQGVPIGFAPAPSFTGAEIIGEIAENYWMALMRDVPFANYGANPDIAAAAIQLSTMSQFNGPKNGNQVTPATQFRGR